MPVQRGLIPPALVLSTVALVMCALSWGALGVVAIAPSLTLDSELDRYLNVLLVTTTICATLVNLFARLVRAIRLSDDGYAAGYADGLDARPSPVPVSPAVTRLVRSPR